ncbi:hypothetical protein MY4824_003099 [Beauveria thailandica]
MAGPALVQSDFDVHGFVGVWDDSGETEVGGDKLQACGAICWALIRNCTPEQIKILPSSKQSPTPRLHAVCSPWKCFMMG